MKKKINLFSIAFIFLAFLTLQACNQDCNCDDNKVSDAGTRAIGLEDNLSFKERLVLSVEDDVAAVQNIETFKFDKSMLKDIELSDLELLRTDVRKPNLDERVANAEAAELVSSIYNSLMAAENTQAQLDVQFLMSEEKVDDGMFLFSIRSQEEQDLVFTMYDEEGFETVANNAFSITEGENYKALNVESLPTGTYLFKLQNKTNNKELVRKLTVENE